MQGRNECVFSRISWSLTLAAIAAGGSMVAMKTNASAAEAGRHPSGDVVRRAGARRSHRPGRPDHRDGDSDPRRPCVLRRQRLHQPGDPVRGAAAAGDLARQLSAAGLRRVLRPRRREPCRTRRGPAATRRPTRRWRTARWSSRRTTRATRRPATATRCGEGPTRNCGLVFGYSSEHQLAQAAKALVRTFYGREPDAIPISAACPTAATKPWSWRSAIPTISTASSPARPPITGRRWPVCSSPGRPRRTETRRASRS